MKKFFNFLLVITISVVSLALTGCGKTTNTLYDENGNMILNLRNVYYDSWTGGDAYTQFIEEKFHVSIKASSYNYDQWSTEVSTAFNGNLTDTFNCNLKHYNMNTYKEWIEFDYIKALPSDMSKYPNLQALINGATNIDSLYVDGKLYAIPLVLNKNESTVDFSSYTYVYRRDWAKELGVYKDNDEYTWSEFKTLLNSFYQNKSIVDGTKIGLLDVEWAFPSVINYYKDSPHCFTLDNNGKVVCNYTTESFITGLEEAKNWVKNANTQYYTVEQNLLAAGEAMPKYTSNLAGVYYENLDYVNYQKIRLGLQETNRLDPDFNLDDASAFLKVKGPDGKYALESSENWFSLTFFNADIPDEKMDMILSIYDYLLSEEGTMLASYGFEGYDYNIIDGEVVLGEGWELSSLTNQYVHSPNGAKYLRYSVTLGRDLYENDPEIDKHTLSIWNAWREDMKNAKENNELRIFSEPSSVKWMSTPTKDLRYSKLLADANAAVMDYVYGSTTLEQYKASFNTEFWNKCLNEINQKLGN